MNITPAKMAGVITALALIVAGCTRPTGDASLMSVPADPPSALVIVTAHPQVDHADVAALVASSARTDEQVEIVLSSGKVLSSGLAPASPVTASPSPPPSLPANPTQFQVDAHHRQEKAFAAKLAADRSALARSLASRRSAWAATAAAPLTYTGPARTGSDLQPGISAATTYFASLQQAGLDLGTHRVLVVFDVSGSPSGMAPLQLGSLAGSTVILANFQGSLRGQEEWQGALLQAGAARVIVLVPAAEDELDHVTQQGLAGQVGPAPADVYFGLNQAGLQPAARTVLRHVAAELNTVYKGAVVTVLGFADPLGPPARNAHLSTDRALAVRAFLVDDCGVAAARISAAGYGTDLPAAPSQADGAQPLDRRAIVVIDPLMT